MEETADVRRVSLRAITEILGVSRSGFKSWLCRKPSESSKRRESVKKEISKIHEESHEIYGAPKITEELKKKGHVISEKTVGNYMHEMHIKAHYIKPWTKTTVSKNFSNRLRNILKRDFDPASPDAAWCTDITYIWTYDDGFVYLTSVMDLFSRKIISWVLTKDMTAESVLEAIKVAQKRRNIRKPVIIHSDRGIQFTGELYKEITEKMKRSYSKKACPWDNACIESFHSLIKREWLNQYKIQNYEDAYKLIFEYIETFYNTVRIHSHCNYQSPNQYEKSYVKSN